MLAPVAGKGHEDGLSRAETAPTDGTGCGKPDAFARAESFMPQYNSIIVRITADASLHHLGVLRRFLDPSHMRRVGLAVGS